MALDFRAKFQLHGLYPECAGSSVTTLLQTFDCGRLLRFSTATAPSRAHRHSFAVTVIPRQFLVNWSARHAPLVPSHEEVLELRGTAGTSCFRQRLFPVRLLGLIFIQAME